jgi:hypothetical protein
MRAGLPHLRERTAPKTELLRRTSTGRWEPNAGVLGGRDNPLLSQSGLHGQLGRHSADEDCWGISDQGRYSHIR